MAETSPFVPSSPQTVLWLAEEGEKDTGVRNIVESINKIFLTNFSQKIQGKNG